MRKLKAISLIESLVYLAVFSIFFLSIVQFLISAAAASRVARERQQLETSAMFVNNHLAEQFKEADTLVVTGNEFSITTGAVTRTYSLVGGRIQVADGVDTLFLTPSFVDATSFDLTSITAAGADFGVDIDLGFESVKESNSTRSMQLTYLVGEI